MCTVTWVRALDATWLFTNRDELRTRRPALPPRVHETAGGRRYLAPVDEEGGGTWIGAAEHGLVLCLLNHYQAAELPAAVQPRSRGLVIGELLDADDPASALERLAAIDLGPVRGFRLLALAPDAGPRLATWDTRRLTVASGADVAQPLVSSAYDLAGVESARRRTFEQLAAEHGGVGPDMLAAFHASERPEPGPYAVSMSRPDAWTVSHTRVRVAPDAVAMHYQSGRPSEGGPIVTARLGRTAPRAR